MALDEEELATQLSFSIDALKDAIREVLPELQGGQKPQLQPVVRSAALSDQDHNKEVLIRNAAVIAYHLHQKATALSDRGWLRSPELNGDSIGKTRKENSLRDAELGLELLDAVDEALRRDLQQAGYVDVRGRYGFAQTPAAGASDKKRRLFR